MSHNLSLILTIAVFVLGVKAHQWHLAKHSPTAELESTEGVNTQASDHLTPVDPTSDPFGEKGKSISNVVALHSAHMDTWLTEQAPTRRTNDLIREAGQRFKVSASTVKRRLRQLRKDATA